jgi:hypothetical protein
MLGFLTPIVEDASGSTTIAIWFQDSRCSFRLLYSGDPEYASAMLTGNRTFHFPFCDCVPNVRWLCARADENELRKGARSCQWTGQRNTPLDGPWQFHVGDDISWADPGFDDSDWEHMDIAKPRGDQGHWAYAGRAWYGRPIEFKDDTKGPADVALYVPIASCAYEVYWYGRLVAVSMCGCHRICGEKAA